MAKRGETRDVIIQAAAKVFFENGFEKTSVKMILEEAHVVTGSFYHFFASKEALFEAVAESFMEAYTRRVSAILDDDTLDMDQIIECFLNRRNSAVLYVLVRFCKNFKELYSCFQTVIFFIGKRNGITPSVNCNNHCFLVLPALPGNFIIVVPQVGGRPDGLSESKHDKSSWLYCRQILS